MSATFSFESWVRGVTELIEAGKASGVKGFTGTADVESPLSNAELVEIRGVLPLELPEAVAEFLVKGSRACRFRYEWKLEGVSPDLLDTAGWTDKRIYGGGELCRAHSFAENIADCRAWAGDTWIADDEEEQEVWLKSFPIMALRNGDYLAVQLAGEPDPAVTYLCHEDTSEIIAPCFTGFLQAWANLYYVGPELWMLESFRDRRTGHVDGTSARAEALRGLFFSELKIRSGNTGVGY